MRDKKKLCRNNSNDSLVIALALKHIDVLIQLISPENISKFSNFTWVLRCSLIVVITDEGNLKMLRKICKKRDLSDNSKNGGKEAKMRRDSSLKMSGWETPNSPGNVFEES